MVYRILLERKQVVDMQRAVNGTYINGQVVLKEPPPRMGRSEVVVVFLDDFKPKAKLSEVFSALGVWEDSCSAEDLSAFIRSSRTERADVCL